MKFETQFEQIYNLEKHLMTKRQYKKRINEIFNSIVKLTKFEIDKENSEKYLKIMNETSKAGLIKHNGGRG
jgi:hypothetical protein